MITIIVSLLCDVSYHYHVSQMQLYTYHSRLISSRNALNKHYYLLSSFFFIIISETPCIVAVICVFCHPSILAIVFTSLSYIMTLLSLIVLYFLYSSAILLMYNCAKSERLASPFSRESILFDTFSISDFVLSLYCFNASASRLFCSESSNSLI